MFNILMRGAMRAALAIFGVFFVLALIGMGMEHLPERQPTVTVAKPYDLHKDPEYIAMSRRFDVKLEDMNWRLGGFDTVMIASFKIKNDRKVWIKDIVVKCDVTAASGTVLDSPTKTVFQSIGPGQSVKIRDLSVGFVRDASQAQSANCYVEDHSDG